VNSLTEATLARARNRFAAWHHEPSSAQWVALRALAQSLESMANGTAPAELALYDLGPAWVRARRPRRSSGRYLITTVTPRLACLSWIERSDGEPFGVLLAGQRRELIVFQTDLLDEGADLIQPAD
jgi:hypothetical protein